MKSIYLFAGASAFAILLSGCAPELDQTGLSPEEKIWAENIKANYSAWEVPESVPRGVRRDDVKNAAGADTAAAATTETVSVPPASDAAPVEPIAADTQAAAAANAGAQTPAPAVEEAAPQSEVYTVVKGDTLGAIARKYYGKASAWKRILDANSDVLKGKTLIRPGMKLQIPRP